MRFFLAGVLFFLFSGPARADPAPSPASPLTADQVFFVETLRGVSGSRTNEAALDLGLDYAQIKYPYGMVNLLDPGQSAVEYRSRLPITDLEKILQVEQQSGVKSGEKFTLVAMDGKTAPATVASFAYLGNSPSTVLVAAILKLKTPDAQMTGQRGLALRGSVKLKPNPRIQLQPQEKIAPELSDRLFALAVPPERLGQTLTDIRVIPARLDASGKIYCFVSYWHHPQGAFDLEDMQSAGSLFRVEGEKIVDLNLPADLEVKAVWDLNGDEKPEILGTAGDGAQVCYRLVFWDGSTFTPIKEGLCAGY